MSIVTVCGDGELRVPLQRLEHLVGIVPGGARVPESETGDPVGVDVLGRALELGEHREIVAGVLGVRVGDLEQHGAVALDDQGSIRHNGRVYRRIRCTTGPLSERSTGDPDLDDDRERQGAFDVGRAVQSTQATAGEAHRFDREGRSAVAVRAVAR